jgi:16S rRNA processing protein RimM
MSESSDLIVMGKVTSVYGIKGWVKVHSYTEPMENLLAYDDCYLEYDDTWQPVSFKDTKKHGKGLVALINGVETREQAQTYCQRNIAIPISNLPATEDGEYYWHQLEGLEVYTVEPEHQPLLLGKVLQMMATGANDVLVVKHCKGSIDKQERLLPWIPEQVIKDVDIQSGVIKVDWDPEF